MNGRTLLGKGEPSAWFRRGQLRCTTQEPCNQYFWNETKNRIDTEFQWSALPVVGVEYEF
jgi:hypothetical protein